LITSGSTDDSFVITVIDGDLTEQYEGLNECDSAGLFKVIKEEHLISLLPTKVVMLITFNS